VTQQGDCDTPLMFQISMTHLCQDQIWEFVHVYLDNIFIFSDTIEDHEKHLQIVMDNLREVEMT